MKKHRIVQSLTLVLTVLAAPAAFGLGSRDVSVASRSQEMRGSGLFKISGSVQCLMSTENNGEPCLVQIRDPRSGTTYGVRNGASVRELYYNGIRDVSVTGTLSEDNTITVEKAESI